MSRSIVRVLLGGAAGGALLAVSACGGGGGILPHSADAAQITITPANGGSGAKPDSPIKVVAAHGTLTQVTVQGGSTAGSSDGSTPSADATAPATPAAVTGTLDAGRTQWTSSGNLAPSTSYTVTATARNSDGKVVTSTSAFRTLTPAKPLYIQDVTPDQPGEKVGVGAPIIVTFNRTVGDKAAVERALKVTSEQPAEGAWRWISGSQVVYRTADYWSPHQKVTFTASLMGVAAGTGGEYGTKNIAKTINIGYSQISTVNLAKGSMTVTRDGKTVRTFDVSGGSGETREYTTTSGVHLTMERDNPVTMTSPGRQPGDPGYYKVEENWAVRISNSGEYVHESDPYSPSHGCIHAGAANAEWFYGIAQRGDVVKVVGTDRSLPWDNGWGYWQLSFNDWKKGSALGAAAGSSGTAPTG